MSTILSPLAPLGRICLCFIFFASAVTHPIPNFHEVVKQMSQQGVPYPNIALTGAIVFLIVGSISVVLGLKGRIGALLLLVFLVAAAYYFHDFWEYTGEDRRTQMIHFMKNLSMAGAMLFIIAVGPGPWSVDGHIERRTEKAKS